ncbi:MAG TPA: T9SS type A sorting domain-containing protein [Ignavibacteriales bacterium]|nr:T9SS type A sorting domain-containing protein [Ignavibacteriales bacterium]
MKSFKVLLFVLFCSFNLISGKIYSQVTPQDSMALVDFFNSTKGQSWLIRTNWLTDKPVSLWYGVKVRGNRVEKISFDMGNNLQDSIPPSIGNLTALKELSLNYNYITSIPREIGALKLLEKLSMRNNQLEKVPPEITALKSLSLLDLSGNYIESLPDSLGSLEGLRLLRLENNKLSEVPSSLGTLKHLDTLVIAGNMLHAIPSFISNIRSLRVLQTGVNPITAIPAEIAHMDSLRELWVNGCILSGLTPEIGNMKSLRKLELQGNFLSLLPSEIDSLKYLEELNLDNNSFSLLPEEIGAIGSLKVLSVRNNALETVPNSIGQLRNLRELRLQHNYIVSIPREIGNLTSLTNLYLNNNLCDTIPKELGNLQNLVYLSLDQNKIKGTIPSALGRMGNLKYLYLEANELDSLPDFSGDTSLVTLTVYDNKLTFEDIEPVLKFHQISFYYGPQDSVGKYTDTMIHPGEIIKLSVKVGGTANRYQWIKNGVLITGANSEVYTLNSKDSLSSGSYNCMITNDNVKDLTIYSRVVNITIGAMTGVAENIEVPKVFELNQNYPNPFNPSTRISYDIPKEDRVVLKIYSAEGREVATLVDEIQGPGKRTVVWNGRDSRGGQVSSGMYFYKLQAGGEIKTRKMILLK